jgi:hypothetical protein
MSQEGGWALEEQSRHLVQARLDEVARDRLARQAVGEGSATRAGAARVLRRLAKLVDGGDTSREWRRLATAR